MEDFEKRKLLSALCHGSIFLSSSVISVGIPILILFLVDDPVVKGNARESLNFHINLYIYAFVCVILIFLVVGIPLLIILGLLSFIMPIIAIVQVLSEPNQVYVYPYIFRLV